jgi:hypothetical protein
MLTAMSDERWNPHHAPVTAPKRPAEALWTITVAGIAWTAELRFHAGAGWEAQILREGELFTAHGAFPTRDAAVRWAEEQRTAAERGYIESL